MLADFGAVLEQTFQRVNQVHIVLSVQNQVAVTSRGKVVGQLLTGFQDILEGSGRTGSTHSVRHIKSHAESIGFNRSSQLSHSRFKDALAEIVKGQGQFVGSEVQVNTFLGANLQGGLLLGGVLSRKGRAGTDNITVRQTDTQAVTDFSTGLGKRVVIGTVHRADEVGLLVKDAQGFLGNHIRGENGIAHYLFL